jgi:hypothetical protein
MNGPCVTRRQSPGISNGFGRSGGVSRAKLLSELTRVQFVWPTKKVGDVLRSILADAGSDPGLAASVIRRARVAEHEKIGRLLRSQIASLAGGARRAASLRGQGLANSP